jgi:hypothetical protein
VGQKNPLQILLNRAPNLAVQDVVWKLACFYCSFRSLLCLPHPLPEPGADSDDVVLVAEVEIPLGRAKEDTGVEVVAHNFLLGRIQVTNSLSDKLKI